VPQLDIMVPSQTWLAHGPGEVWSRRLGNGNPLGAITPTSDPTNPPINERFTENEKQCIHLSFFGRMEGNMAQRIATFYDRIAALIGPIASWDDALNVHTVERLGRNQSLLYSDQLNIFDASGLSWNQSQNMNRGTNNSAWELEARSRVKMQSNTESGELSVQAESLKYAAISDTVRVDGTSQQPAIISKSQANAPPIVSNVNTASIRLKTGEMSVQIVNVEGSLPPNMQTPNASPGSRPVPSVGQGANNILPSARDTPLRPVNPGTRK